eukprot:scaffold240352_cov30-Tisochrysis_lutea.AAC.1
MFPTWPVGTVARHLACRADEESQQSQTQMWQSSEPDTSSVPPEFHEIVLTQLRALKGKGSEVRRKKHVSARVRLVPSSQPRTRRAATACLGG